MQIIDYRGPGDDDEGEEDEDGEEDVRNVQPTGVVGSAGQEHAGEAQW